MLKGGVCVQHCSDAAGRVSVCPSPAEPAPGCAGSAGAGGTGTAPQLWFGHCLHSLWSRSKCVFISELLAEPGPRKVQSPSALNCQQILSNLLK